MKNYIYAHRRISDNSIFYIGRSVNRSGYYHRMTTGKRHQSWHDVVNQEGGFKFQLLAKNLTKSVAIKLEKQLINSHFENLINIVSTPRHSISNPNQRTVIQSKDGIIINEFPSMSEASRQTGISQANISQVVNGNIPHAGGFKWESPTKKWDNSGITVYAYRNGVYTGKFPSISKASQILDVPPVLIKKALLTKKTTKSYQFTLKLRK